MATDTRLKESLPAITERIVETYEECGAIHHLGHCPLPSYREVVEVMADLPRFSTRATGADKTCTWATSPTTWAT